MISLNIQMISLNIQIFRLIILDGFPIVDYADNQFVYLDIQIV